MIDGKVYIRANQDGLDNAAMKYRIIELNLSDGKERMITLPDMWGDFAAVFCNGKLYYLGGRSDISTTSLYVVDLESGNVTVIDKSTAQGLMTDGTSIFYVHCDADAFTEKSPAQLIEYNTVSGKTEILLQDTYGNVGWVCHADQKYILSKHYQERKEYLRIYDRSTGKSKELDSQGEQYFSFIQGEDRGFYFSAFSDYVKDGVSYGKAPYHVFYYDYAEQNIKEVGSAEEYVIGIADRHIYYVKWENHEPKPVRVPFGNVASPHQISDQQQLANNGEYVLPDSDSRYYDKEELKKLTHEELRLARNEIYARHGYIFESEDLKKHFTSKSWYVPSVESEQFDQKILNNYEQANLNLILEYEGE